MASASSPCKGLCKQPTYLLDELNGKIAYRNRPAMVPAGSQQRYFGVMGAQIIAVYDDVFACLDPLDDNPHLPFKKIDKCYWDCSWKPVNERIQIKKIHEFEPSVMGQLPCTCDQMCITIDKVVSKFAYRDRPKVFYSQGSDDLIPGFDYEFCGVRNRVFVERVGKVFLGTNRRGEQLEIHPSLHDYNWKVYHPTGQEVDEEELILDKKESTSENEVIVSARQEPVLQTAGSAPAANVSQKIPVESPLRRSLTTQDNLASLAVDPTNQASEASLGHSSEESIRLPPPPIPLIFQSMNDLSSVRLEIVEVPSAPETPVDSEEARHKKRQNSNWCAKICCCFKRCCPKYF